MSATLAEPHSGSEWITDDDVREREEGAEVGKTSVLTARDARLRKGDEDPRPEPIRVLVSRDPPRWLQPTVHVLAELLSLEENWDSYGALPVARHNVYTALEVLIGTMRDNTPIPEVVPTCRGGVQLEWHTRDIDLEIETVSPFKLDVLCEDSKTGEEFEDEIWLLDLHRLADWVGRLS